MLPYCRLFSCLEGFLISKQVAIYLSLNKKKKDKKRGEKREKREKSEKKEIELRIEKDDRMKKDDKKIHHPKGIKV